MTAQTPPPGGRDSVFPGHGELAARMRALDWAKTPVGPVEGWPQSLRTIVRVMLTSRYAMWMGWGPEFTFFYNDAYRPTLGVKHEWALGASARAVWAEIWADIGPRAEHVVRSGEATFDEGLLLIVERRGFPEESFHTFSYSPLPDDVGGIGGMLCVVTEDTERTIGERRLQTLRALAAATGSTRTVHGACQAAVAALAQSPEDLPLVLLYLFDDDGATARLAASCGVPAQALRVAPPTIALQPEALEESPWLLRALLTAPEALTVRGLAARLGPVHAGPWPEALDTAVVLPLGKAGTGELCGALVAGISPRRPLDDRYRGFLGLVAGQVASALNEARAAEAERRRAEQLAELDRAKSLFFSNVSHEFRTPLTLMLGPLDDLLAGREGPLAAPVQAALALVHRSGQRLQRLVNALLDFSRLEAGRVQAALAPVDLAAYTTDLASMFQAAIERAGMSLVIDCPPLPAPVPLDRDLWEKILLNLLGNAFKYTHAGSIRVSLRAEEGQAVLRVMDTGVGIPAHELPNLFKRFHRVAGARGRTHEGSGIGLALVHELVKLHGGAVSVDSAEGQGSTFTVRIPASGVEAQGPVPAAPLVSAGASAYVAEATRELTAGARAPVSAAAEEPRPDAAPRPCVLLADDNSDMREYLQRLLSGPYEVLALRDGVEALAVAAERRPDLVLTDVMMPALDGFGLLRALRADLRTAAIPIIVVSARAGEEARVEGLAAGADDYLVKPFSSQELLARVAGALALARVRRESEQQARAILESITDGFIALDRGWRFSYVNAEAEALLGMTRAELAGRDFFAVFPATRETAVETSLHRAAQERVTVTFEHYYTPWGRWFAARVYPAADGISIYFQEITARRQAEEALREADRRKDEFLATLAHELRNPLAPLRTGMTLLRRAPGGAAAVRTVEMMERQLAHMVRLIDDLLDVARISRGVLELRRQEVSVQSIISGAVEAARPFIERADLALTVEGADAALRLDADPTRLVQVVANLLHNAAKYTPAGGHVAIQVTREEDALVLRLRDSGVGIPAELLPRIFDLFTQVGSSLMERSQGGLGIGLSLARRLVELHGGTLSAESPGPGAGSTFTVRLPLLLTPPARAGSLARGASAAAASPGHLVLVVDDNVDAAESLAEYLQLLGQRTCTAYSGPAALEAARAMQPRLILLDIGLPGLSGYEVAARLREDGLSKDALLVALTGWSGDGDRRRAHEAGFDHHLTKPVDIARVEALLKTLDETDQRRAVVAGHAR